jgi:hypothetical protein
MKMPNIEIEYIQPQEIINTLNRLDVYVLDIESTFETNMDSNQTKETKEKINEKIVQIEQLIKELKQLNGDY